MVHGLEGGGRATPKWGAPAAGIVAAIRPLDLHHVRTQRGEDGAGIRAGDVYAKLDDFDAGQGQGAAGVLELQVHGLWMI